MTTAFRSSPGGRAGIKTGAPFRCAITAILVAVFASGCVQGGQETSATSLGSLAPTLPSVDIDYPLDEKEADPFSDTEVRAGPLGLNLGDFNGDWETDAWDMNGNGVWEEFDRTSADGMFLDGIPDAFDLDEDGEIDAYDRLAPYKGVPDFWPLDDGTLAIDTNDDGLPDYWDDDLDEVADATDARPPFNGRPDTWYRDDGTSESDTNNNGIPDMLFDNDGDNVWDSWHVADVNPNQPYQAVLNLDEDAEIEAWILHSGLRQIDTNGDQIPDLFEGVNKDWWQVGENGEIIPFNGTLGDGTNNINTSVQVNGPVSTQVEQPE